MVTDVKPVAKSLTASRRSVLAVSLSCPMHTRAFFRMYIHAFAHDDDGCHACSAAPSMQG
jgi:hypothetical protein